VLAGVGLATIGCLLAVLGSRGRNELLAPGPLTSHHAQVLARGDASQRCATCHPGADSSPVAWLGVALVGNGADPHATQSSLCLECHKELAAEGGEPLLAHGVPTESLPSPRVGNKRTLAALASLTSIPAPGTPRGSTHDDPVACAVCHQEHHGPGHDLAAITDRRCQACHQARYASFANDHPEFSDWPYQRPTRIAFSHTSHASRHYTKSGRAFDCRSCHVEDAAGDLTARVDYAGSCGSCHDADLQRSLAGGVPLVTLPTLDDTALGDQPALRGWPEGARGDFDGDAPPLMKLLLASDPKARAAIERLGPDFSFFDIDAAEPESVEAAAAIIAALRAMLDELQEEGHANLDYRLRKLTAGAPLPRPMSEFVARLPVELVDHLQAKWFTQGNGASPAFEEVEDRRTGGGWWVDDRTHSLRYRPTGHDDPFLRAWLDLIAALPPEQAALRDACLAEFARPGAPGQCLECHGVERAAGAVSIAWRGRDRLSEPRAFTKFSHRPHLTQPELADCAHCHRSTAAPGTQATASRPNGVTLVSAESPTAPDFAPIAKSSCSECHRPHAAGDHCTQCHHYHVSPLATGGASPRHQSEE
jgi:mono/diheme cytochrome c family protein